VKCMCGLAVVVVVRSEVRVRVCVWGREAGREKLWWCKGNSTRRVKNVRYKVRLLDTG
jgi:hypothetical protein